MSTFTTVADTIYTYRFLKVLTTKWKDMDAYKFGLIDANGKKTGKKASTSEEKSSYTFFHRLAFNLKRLIQKVPGGRSQFASYAAALFLLREHANLSEKDLADVLDKAGIEQGDLNLTESWMMVGEELGVGRYVLTEDIASPKTGEMIAKAGSTIIAKANCSPVDTIFNAHIYEVLHEQTKQNIYVTVADIKR